MILEKISLIFVKLWLALPPKFYVISSLQEPEFSRRIWCMRKGATEVMILAQLWPKRQNAYDSAPINTNL